MTKGINRNDKRHKEAAGLVMVVMFGANDRPPVAGVVGRDTGRAHLEVIGRPSRAELERVVEDHTAPDSAVYTELERMSVDGLTFVARGYYRSYGLTEEGYNRGAALLDQVPAAAKDFIGRSARWVHSLSFAQLVSAIYQKYPEMKAASVFRDD